MNLLMHSLIAASTMTLAGFSQVYSDKGYGPGSSLDIVTDPRSIALGEATIADAGNPTALGSNPANVAYMSGPEAFYNYRSYNLWEDDYTEGYYPQAYAWSLGYASAFQFGGAAITFRKNVAEKNIDEHDYNQTISLTYGTTHKNIGAGTTIKLFNRSSKDNPGRHIKASYVPGLDFGVMYHFSGITDNAAVDDNLFVGAAIQNLFPAHETEEAYVNEEGDYDDDVEEQEVALPLYLRTGFKYDFKYHSSGNQTPFKFVLTGEYRRYLNRAKDLETIGLEWAATAYYGRPVGKNYGGLGFEVMLYELLSLRMGGVFFSQWNFFGDANRLAMRYGVGIDLGGPLAKHQIWVLPPRISLNYAPIVLQQSNWDTRKYLHSFGIRLLY